MSDDTAHTRLNKFLALHLGIARRQADDLIAKQKVSINGTVAILGAHVNEGDEVVVDGKKIETKTTLEYIALHKPVGYVCSRRPQGDSPTVYSLLPPSYSHLKLVGRLDRESSGIILLTNDGDFAQRMTHPSYHKIKKYIVELDHPLEPLHHQMIVDFGVQLDDGKSQFELARLSDTGKQWQVTMHEGRNRQIRRTFAALGYTVIMLHRTDFGQFSLSDLALGQFREVQV